jgi:hypothetical protein
MGRLLVVCFAAVVCLASLSAVDCSESAKADAGSNSEPAGADTGQEHALSTALRVVVQELAAANKAKKLMDDRLRLLTELRQRLVAGIETGSSKSSIVATSAAVDRVLQELEDHQGTVTAEARQRMLAAREAAAGNALPRMASSSDLVRGFDDFFVARSSTSLPRIVSVFSVALSPAGIGSRSATARRQAAIHASVSSHCLVTVSSVGLISVVSASGAVVATHQLHHAVARDAPPLDVTAAGFGGDHQPYVAVATRDGFLWLVEVTVFVDGQRVLGRSLAKRQVDAKSAELHKEAKEAQPPAAETGDTAEVMEAAADGTTTIGNQTHQQADSGSLPDSDPAVGAGSADWRHRRTLPLHPDAPAAAGTSALLYQEVKLVYLPSVARHLAHMATRTALQKHTPPPWQWCGSMDEPGAQIEQEERVAAACEASAEAYLSESAPAQPDPFVAVGGSIELPAGDVEEDAAVLSAWRESGGGQVEVTSVQVYRITGHVIVATGDSTGTVAHFDVDGHVTRVAGGTTENQPGRQSVLSLQEQRQWLLHQPLLSRPAAAEWMTFWAGIGGTLPSRCGCPALPRQPLLPPRRVGVASSPALAHGAAVTALARFSAYLAVARGSRLAFTTAGHLRETGSICEVPGASATGVVRPETTIVSLAYDQLNTRFVWAGSAAGDVLVFDVRASATTRDSSRRATAGIGQCRLAHRFSLASLTALDKQQLLQAAAEGAASSASSLGAEQSDSEEDTASAEDQAHWDSPLSHASVATTRGYAVVATLGGVFLFNSTGIGALSPRLVASRRESPKRMLALVTRAAGGSPIDSQPALLALGQSMPRVGADPIAAWTPALVCAPGSSSTCQSALRAATLLLPSPVRKDSMDVGWFRFPAIAIVVVGVLGYQLCSRGPQGAVEGMSKFWTRLRKLLGLIPDSDGGSGGGGGGGGYGGNPFSTDTLSRDQKLQVADLLRRAQAERLASGGLGSGLGSGGIGGGRGGNYGFDDDAGDGGMGMGGSIPDPRTASGDRWRREQLDALGLEAEMERAGRTQRPGRGSRYDAGIGMGAADARDAGIGLGGGGYAGAGPGVFDREQDDVPIGEWLED